VLLHYLVKGGCSKFSPNVTIILLRFGVKVKRARRPLPDMGRLSGDDFYVSTVRDAVAFLEREMRETRRRHLGAGAHFASEHISSTNSDNFEPICHDN